MSVATIARVGTAALSSAAVVLGCAVFRGEDGTSGAPDPAEAGAEGGADGPVVQAQPLITFNVEAPSRVFAGDTFELTVTIVRTGAGSYPGPIRFELVPLPGVTMAATDVAAEVTTVKVPAKTHADRKHGPVSVEIVATSLDGDARGSAKSLLGVRGRPGELDNSFATNGFFQLAEDSEASAVDARPPPGSEIVVGARVGTGVGILRLKPEGMLDMSFATAGTLRASPAGTVVETSNLDANHFGVTVDVGGPPTVRCFGFATTEPS